MFEAVEKFSVIKTLQAIEASNVVLLMLDAQTEISEQDAHIAGFVLETGRAVVPVSYTHLSVVKGTRPDENHVSSTSGSRLSSPLTPAARACWIASASSWATNTWPSSAYQAGIWWPHHSWREIHQS